MHKFTCIDEKNNFYEVNAANYIDARDLVETKKKITVLYVMHNDTIICLK